MAQHLFSMVRNERERQHPVIQLLEHIHVCGERLFDALIGNDLETALRLLNEREGMIGRLQLAESRPDEETLRPIAASLSAQNERISDALDLRRQAIETALDETMRLRRGNAGYAQPGERRKVLRAGLEA